MAKQYAIQDQNRFPGNLVHTGTANTAETIRRTGQTSGAADVHITSSGVNINNASYAFSYTSGNLTQIDKVVGGGTYTKTLTWTSGDLTAITAWS